jgi:hypothetical protein
MSVDFTAKIIVKQSFIDDDGSVHTFGILESSLYLGNSRALRSICPINENKCIEDSGKVELQLFDFVPYLESVDCILTKAAKEYVRCLVDNLCKQDTGSVIIIYAEVSWA